jgi:preprotein translocase subunit SecG
MVVINSILLTVFAIDALLLILIIMLQDDQGEGLGGLFAGGSSTAFGSRAGNVLTRFTAWLGVIFFVVAVVLGFVNSSRFQSRGLADEVQAQEETDKWYILESAEPETEESSTESE